MASSDSVGVRDKSVGSGSGSGSDTLDLCWGQIGGASWMGGAAELGGEVRV